MKTLAIYLLETLACSGVLLAVYMVLLERRVRFDWCRAYLLLSTLLAALIPLLRIPVWPGKVIEIEAAARPTEMQWATDMVKQASPTITPELITALFYAVGVVLILGAIGMQLRRIASLRRGAVTTHTDCFTLIRTRQRIASFSFFRSIYVWDGTPEEELNTIILHEASHIAHLHSIERIAMESLKALLWWNPFVWISARRLTEVEEFEADSDVLASGYEVIDYMNVIFKQLYGYSPDIANSLRDSLTKKRFKMMTTKNSGRHALLRLAATLPVLIGLLCAFSFTTQAAVYTQPNRPAEPTAAAEAQPTSPKKQQVTVIAKFIKDDKFSTGNHAAEAIIKVANSNQNKPAATTAPKEEDEPFVIVETMPQFQGGNVENFRQWVMKNVRYPAEAFKAKVQGRVLITFVIDRAGKLGSVEVFQSPDKSLSEEVVRVLNTSPEWTPGKQRGEIVSVKYTIPIDFKFSTDKQASNSTQK